MTSVVAVMGQGIVAEDQPILVADDFGFTRGDGCFDATRVSVAPDGSRTVDHLAAHLDRFAASAAGLDLKLDRGAWEELIGQAVDAWTVPGEATLKMLITRGREYSGEDTTTGVVTITPIAQSQLRQRDGVKLAVLSRGMPADAFRDARWLLGGVKTISYAVNMAAKREAARRGADDALFITTDDYVLEGPNAALVWIKENVVYSTPHENTGVLRSITQALTFDRAREAGLETRYHLARLQEIIDADGAWLLSSIRGVAPVVALDEVTLTPHPTWTRQINEWTGFPA